MAVVTLPTLRLGSTGVHVSELQRLLNKVGMFDGSMFGRVDVNVVGPVTSEAVKRFQSSTGMQPTGVVDDATWTKLYVIAGEAKIVSAPLATATAQPSASPNYNPAVQAMQAGSLAMPPVASVGTTGRGSGILGKLFLFGIVGVGSYVIYRAVSKQRGMAELDDGEDNAGPAFTVPRPKAPRLAGSARKKKPVKRAKEESAEGEGTWSAPSRGGGRNAVRSTKTEWAEDDDRVWLQDPGRAPNIIKLEADEKMFKNQRGYREDMKRMAWERARANERHVQVVVRGTSRVLYNANPNAGGR